MEKAARSTLSESAVFISDGPVLFNIIEVYQRMIRANRERRSALRFIGEDIPPSARSYHILGKILPFPIKQLHGSFIAYI
mgnify:CR=1 FL=1